MVAPPSGSGPGRGCRTYHRQLPMSLEGGSGASATATEILTELYEATLGAQWSDATNWASGDPCEWAGVDCVDSEVTSFVRANKQLNGTLPSSIALLTSLHSFEANFNAGVSGTLPSEFGQLALSSLKLQNTGLSGFLPTQLGMIGGLAVDIDLSGNRFSGVVPTEIGQLDVERLRLFNNALSGSVPSEITKLRPNECILGHEQDTFSAPGTNGAAAPCRIRTLVWMHSHTRLPRSPRSEQLRMPAVLGALHLHVQSRMRYASALLASASSGAAGAASAAPTTSDAAKPATAAVAAAGAASSFLPPKASAATAAIGQLVLWSRCRRRRGRRHRRACITHPGGSRAGCAAARARAQGRGRPEAASAHARRIW